MMPLMFVIIERLTLDIRKRHTSLRLHASVKYVILNVISFPLYKMGKVKNTLLLGPQN